jgi:hypothetical protein
LALSAVWDLPSGAVIVWTLAAMAWLAAVAIKPGVKTERSSAST